MTSESTEKAPADSPKIVTFLGSPPNAWIFLCTHWRAARWSRKPGLRSATGSSGDPGKPNTENENKQLDIHEKDRVLTIRSVVMRYYDYVLVGGESRTLEIRIRGMAVLEGAAIYPE